MTDPLQRPDERRLEGSVYVDDDGSPDPVLHSMLIDHEAGTATYPAVLAALAAARLLVPVVALLGETGEGAAGADGQTLVTDKSSDMAAVLLTGADGRLALLAFTDLSTLAAWDPAARPVPVAAHLAAATAVQEGAEALVVDIAGPRRFVLSGEDLHRLAAGWRPVRLEDGGWGWLGSTDEAAED
ncbi:MAG: SseB family protein [Nocardioidaceae bacterium]|nr:SseB family protein [Nocardioidaceae bacterium]